MEPRRRLSFILLLILALTVTGLSFAGWTQGSEAYQRITAKPSSTWFAPYEDVTLTPEYHFEDPVVSPSLTQMLGFVVADPKSSCTPTWGTYYDLDGAGRALDLDRRITRLRERGGDAVISFGGAANTDLAVACTSQPALNAAYQVVARRYSSKIIDLDIEGAALADKGATLRRAIAMKALQAASPAGKRVRIWLTLPASPSGLSADAIGLITTMLRQGVAIDGINLMTMDFGGSLPKGESMRSGIEHAVEASQLQLATIYRQAGVMLTPRQVYERMGATPMIGQNDVQGETFTLSDAHALVAFAKSVHLARVSIWSANRDSQCGVQSLDGQVSNTCSGVAQRPLAFAWELGRLNGHPPVRTTAPALPDPSRTPTRDDPATSPYPIWRASKTYRAGEEIVWHHRVYEAKWYTSGDVPDAPVKHLWDTPWRYLGPVLKSDVTTAAASSALGSWNPDQVYLEGSKVLYNGLIYEARWWTQADVPTSDPQRLGNVPWKALGVATAAQLTAASDSLSGTSTGSDATAGSGSTN
jgi:chitinase